MSAPDDTSQLTFVNGTCFDECDCSCNDQSILFDKLIAEETLLGVSLHQIIHSSILWYIDKSIDDSGLTDVRFPKPDGVYILWHKNDYCAVHETFHMKALYVGKGNVAKRMAYHWANKNTEDEMLIYFSYFPCKNRTAKYIEQLLLDIFNFPLNRSENKGKDTLCAYFSQFEVD